MGIANTIGIAMPDDFPTDAYNGVHDRLRVYRNKDPVSTAWLEYGGGWNAVASRFKTLADADEKFTRQVTRSSLSHEEIQLQEEYLFAFFVNGYATLESFWYAAFALGGLLVPAEFPMSTEKDLRAITPPFVQKRFESQFATSSISVLLTGLVPDGSYKDWGNIRNVLSHRVLPGRTYHAHVHEGPGPDTLVDPPTGWGKITLDEHTTKSRRAWLAMTLTQCVEAAEAFTKQHF